MLTTLASEPDLSAAIAGTALIHFWAPWCEPCHQLDRVLEALSGSHPGVVFGRVEAEALPEVAERCSIEAVPTVILFRNNTEVARSVGFQPGALSGMLSALSAPAPPAPPAAQPLRLRIEALIRQQPIMLFMKGSPEQPRCGFSRQMVQVLQGRGVEFGSFDILQDDTIRQGLKDYSNWPTYPQLYAHGRLVGGLDVVKELDADGSLMEELQAQD